MLISQMGELIGEIQLKEKRKKLITKTLQELNNILTSLPSQEVAEVSTVLVKSWDQHCTLFPNVVGL